MNYYEEFGLSPGTSEAEIRLSYRRIVQVLHPDQYQDPKMKELAEVQLKRINGIASILLNPERRRLYDASLSNQSLVIIPVTPTISSRIRSNFVWVLLGASIATMLILAIVFLTRRPVETAQSPAPYNPTPKVLKRPGEAPARAADPVTSAADPTRTAEPSAGPADPDIGATDPTTDIVVSDESKASPKRQNYPRSRPLERPQAKERSQVQPAETDGIVAESKTITDQAVDLPKPEMPSSDLPAPTPSQDEPVPSVLGRWVFTPNPNEPPEKGYYPAEYVELSILSSGAALHGFYRARYKVRDRALNPVVEFNFEGPRDRTSFAWRDDAGAKGVIKLLLEHPNTLKIEWVASAMGNTMSLGSGNAVLYRFR